MNRKPWIAAVPIGAALFVLLLAVSRSNEGEESKAPRARRAKAVRSEPVESMPLESTRSAGRPARSERAAGLRPAEDPWSAFERTVRELAGSREAIGEASYRQSVLDETCRLLGFDPTTSLAFATAEQVVQVEFVRIQRSMGEEFSVQPVDLNDEELQRIQLQVEYRHRQEKQFALAKLEAFLDDRESHRRFHEGLESWLADLCCLEP